MAAMLNSPASSDAKQPVDAFSLLREPQALWLHSLEAEGSELAKEM